MDLPLIDVHSMHADASPDALWTTVVAALPTRLALPYTYLRLLDVDPLHRSGSLPAIGATIPGFAVRDVEPGRTLVLGGRHRFSRYELRLDVEAAPDGSVLTAQTRAAFPGASGRGYQRLVIRSGIHRLLTRRLLERLCRDAEAAGVRDRSAPRTVLVTGAATGIGRAVALALARSGWRVIATSLPGQDAAPLRHEGVTVVPTDLADSSSRDVLVARVREEGRLHALVSNAGIALPGPLEGLPTEALTLPFQVNAIAPIALTGALLPMLRRTSGRMVFIGAGQGRLALPFGGPYAASKAALAALTDALRAEVHDQGVRVALLELGAVRTGILARSREAGMTHLDQLPADLAARYRDPVVRTFDRAERAFDGAMSPEDVAALVLRVLTSPTPRDRYVVGREARALALIARLPAGLRSRLVARMAR